MYFEKLDFFFFYMNYAFFCGNFIVPNTGRYAVLIIWY